ncbi:hypothetical protein HDV03_001060 [Kappamyces sp. JEL0829]|nr:hypothetical protein HDV03_001060 [Kappamyces sp. JEL0829]
MTFLEDTEPQSATSDVNMGGPPQKPRRILMCIGVILVFVGAIVGFSGYIASGSKKNTAVSASESNPAPPVAVPEPVYPAPLENVNPPGTVSSITCPCGYVDSATGDHYNFMAEVDFASLASLGSQVLFTPLNKVSPSPTGQYAKAFNASQVSLSADGLVMTVQHTGTSANIMSAQMESTIQNILFGSFRVTMKLPTNRGTCSAMFYFLDDVQEIDMEFLSSYAGDNAPHSFYGTQTGDFNQINNPNAWASLPYAAEQTTGFQEYRFDWTATKVDYYYNGAKVHTATDGVPQNPGMIIMNHWSSGAVGWEQGPPTQPTNMIVKSFKAYFNTTYDPKSCTATSKPACSASRRPKSTLPQSHGPDRPGPKNLRRRCLVVVGALLLIGGVGGYLLYRYQFSDQAKLAAQGYISQQGTRSSCPCPGVTPQPFSESQYAASVSLDFTKLADLGSQSFFAAVSQTLEKSPGGQYRKAFDAGHLSLSSSGLGLTVTPYSPNPSAAVYGGQVSSLNTNILYGSFRTKMRLPSEPGSCVGFFVYHNETTEIDTEYVGSFGAANNPFNFFGTQTGNPNQITNATIWKQQLADPSQTAGFVEYRMDWVPGQIQFLRDGVEQFCICSNVPQVGGSINLNHWSGGSPGWEKGPVVQNATVVVQSFTAFYNTANTTAPVHSKAACHPSNSTLCLE